MNSISWSVSYIGPTCTFSLLARNISVLIMNSPTSDASPILFRATRSWHGISNETRPGSWLDPRWPQASRGGTDYSTSHWCQRFTLDQTQITLSGDMVVIDVMTRLQFQTFSHTLWAICLPHSNYPVEPGWVTQYCPHKGFCAYFCKQSVTHRDWEQTIST